MKKIILASLLAASVSATAFAEPLTRVPLLYIAVGHLNSIVLEIAHDDKTTVEGHITALAGDGDIDVSSSVDPTKPTPKSIVGSKAQEKVYEVVLKDVAQHVWCASKEGKRSTGNVILLACAASKLNAIETLDKVYKAENFAPPQITAPISPAASA